MVPDILPVSGRLFRDRPVDLLRGIAIVLMVGANTIPYLLAPPAPFALRGLSSLAAPLFILLSGMMVTLSCTRKRRPFSWFLLRGGLVILVAALLEALVWGIVPGTGMDVLFLIGLSLPLAFLFLQLPRPARWGILAGIFCMTPVAEFIVGYPALPLQVPLPVFWETGIAGLIPAAAGDWIAGGWFPVFPWLGVALLGAELGTVRWTRDGIRSFATRRTAASGLLVLCLGSLLWTLYPGQQLVRYGYAELFYPPVPGFCLFAAGAILCMFVIADLLPPSRIPAPLMFMGECSLAIYILHSAVIAWIIAPCGLLLPLPAFLLCVCIFLLGMYAFACLLHRLRGYAGGSFMFRFLCGG